MGWKAGIALMVAGGLGVSGCTNMQVRTPSAIAKVAPTKGQHVEGTVNFLQRGDKLLVEARVTGLTPGLHGFHVHEKGDCSAPDGSSAGPHFNPHKASHGGTEGERGRSRDETGRPSHAFLPRVRWAGSACPMVHG